MNSKRIQLVGAGVAAWISLLLMITTTYGGSIVIGGNYTDIGTIVIISPKPGDTAQTNGTALLNNLAAIPGGDANNPYVIKLGPGIYDVGAGIVQMKEYVDIEGSGENTTVITGHIGFSHGVVEGASHAEIRFLTVRNTGGGEDAIAILNDSASPKMTNVTASASEGTGENFGVYNVSSSPTMTNVTAWASGGTYNSYGVFNKSSSSPTMTNVTASASGGAYNYGVYSRNTGTVRINNSVITGSTNTIYNGSETTTRVANTRLEGGPVLNWGTLTCVGAYDGNYIAFNTNCQ